MEESRRLGLSLKKERLSLGITLNDAAHKIGFQNYQSLSSIESGERELKAWELAKLANLYGRDMDYFLTPHEERKDTYILWRDTSYSSVKDKTGRMFLSFCEKYQHLQDLLEEEKNTDAGFPHINKKDMLGRDSFEYIAQIASRYIKIYDLGSRPSCILPKILENDMAIKIISLDLDYGLSGGATLGDFGPAILLNSNDAPWRRNYDLAHEFFHVITWELFDSKEIQNVDKKGKNRIEQLADIFASSLLLPEQEIQAVIKAKIRNNKISHLDLVETARDFGVSLEALLWRLVNLGIFQKEIVKKELESGKVKDLDRKIRSREWVKDKPYLSARYITLAIRALQLGKISKAKFAEYVGKKFSEISSFLMEYGYNENEDYSVEYSTS